MKSPGNLSYQYFMQIVTTLSVLPVVVTNQDAVGDCTYIVIFLLTSHMLFSEARTSSRYEPLGHISPAGGRSPIPCAVRSDQRNFARDMYESSSHFLEENTMERSRQGKLQQ